MMCKSLASKGDTFCVRFVGGESHGEVLSLLTAAGGTISEFSW